MNCRHCGALIEQTMLDLGSAPPSNSYLTSASLASVERWYPLRVRICTRCWLVQTEDYTGRDEFFSSDYAYFSSFSSTWLAHCKEYMGKMVNRFNLNSESMVVEVAANDGYLLQFFKQADIPCYGIEPTESTANAARKKGIEIRQDFFGVTLANELAASGRQADLMIANNVLAHVPDINDFVAGFAHLLKPMGICTFEFPHIVNLIALNQFDTIYHEHYSYLSLTAVVSILESAGLNIFDVEPIPTHGGSLRVFAQIRKTGTQAISSNVEQILQNEINVGVKDLAWYTGLQSRARNTKMEFLEFLIKIVKSGKIVAGYGAAAKGNTLLNYCGIKNDLIAFVCDAAQSKQGKYLPGSRIPIMNSAALKENRPDYVVIFPWNIHEEIKRDHAYIKEWGGKFVTVIPDLVVS